jgi:paired amphipathic helix protein Sin3a
MSQSTRDQSGPFRFKGHTSELRAEHGRSREVKLGDAVNYLNEVKREFSDRPHISNEFLETMKNFETHKLDAAAVALKICRMFRGHNNLILGFNLFLPDGFPHIELKDLAQGGKFEHAVGGNEIGGNGCPGPGSMPPPGSASQPSSQGMPTRNVGPPRTNQ